jgi:hypothetical protein
VSFRHKSQEVVLEIYNDQGLEHTLTLCEKLLDVANNKNISGGFEKVSMVRGKLCEAVLEVLILEYIKLNELQDTWFYVPSLYLRDIHSQNMKFRSEVDMVLFTPSRQVLFECKNLSGEKLLVDKGVIKRKGVRTDTDVYTQQKKHLDVFVGIFDSFKLRPVNSGYKICMFDFSSGSLEDRREDSWKNVFPVLNKDNLFEYLDNIRKMSPLWDLSNVKKAVRLLEKNKDSSAERHLDYVRSLHPKSDNSK